MHEARSAVSPAIQYFIGCPLRRLEDSVGSHMKAAPRTLAAANTTSYLLDGTFFSFLASRRRFDAPNASGPWVPFCFADDGAVNSKNHGNLAVHAFSNVFSDLTASLCNFCSPAGRYCRHFHLHMALGRAHLGRQFAERGRPRRAPGRYRATRSADTRGRPSNQRSQPRATPCRRSTARRYTRSRPRCSTCTRPACSRVRRCRLVVGQLQLKRSAISPAVI